MKNKYIFGLMIALISLLAVSDSEAIGGRGGGGRGGGGGGRGGGGGPRGGGGGGGAGRAQAARPQAAARPAQARPQAAQRPASAARPAGGAQFNRGMASPSMSRADIRPGGAGAGNIARPSQHPGMQRPTAPGGGGLGQGRHADVQSQLKQQLQQSGLKNLKNQNLGGNRAQQFKSGYSQLNRQNRQAVNHVANRIQQNHPNRNNWFNNQFFNQHNYTPNYWHAGNNWWRPATWGAAASWLSWYPGGGSYPAYYYGDEGYPVELSYDDANAYIPTEYNTTTYQPQVNIYGGTPPAPPPEEPITDSSTIQGDWLPLGVFAAGKSTTQAGYSNMFVQLALSKEGDISGTYYNAGTDQTHPIEGLVDRDTQVVLWKLSDKPDSPIMTTGLYNLTQDVAPVKVQFSSGPLETWYLVRVNQ